MSALPACTLDRDEWLVAELHRLGVRHLARLKVSVHSAASPTPLDLITGLATSDDARLQAALILLFLRRPAYSQHLPVVAQLSEAAATEVKLYYQAAVYLQAELEPTLRAHVADWQPLPDLFSAQLNLPAPDTSPPGEALRALGERHRQTSGLACNWAASYRQNIPRFLKHLRNDAGYHRPGTPDSISKPVRPARH